MSKQMLRVINNKVQRENMIQRVLCFDWVMKKTLESKANFVILESFLSELLKHNIKIIKIFANDKDKNDDSAKFKKVDLLIRLDDTEEALVEIQLSVEDNYLYRMFSGSNEILNEYLKEESALYGIHRVYVVNVLYSDDLSGSDSIYKSTTPFIGINKHDQLVLTERQKLIFQYPEYYLLKVKQFDDVIRDSLDEWVYFFKNAQIKDGFSARGLVESKALLEQEHNNINT